MLNSNIDLSNQTIAIFIPAPRAQEVKDILDCLLLPVCHSPFASSVGQSFFHFCQGTAQIEDLNSGLPHMSALQTLHESSSTALDCLFFFP